MTALLAAKVRPVSCFDPILGLGMLPDKSVDHVITDPPYEAHVHAGNRRSQTAWGNIVAPVMDFSAITDEQRFAAAYEFARISCGWILVFCSIEGVKPWQDVLMAAGARRRNTMIWAKPNPPPKFQGDGPGAACEAIVTAWTGKGKSVWNAGGLGGFYFVAGERRWRRHSTQKPAALMRQLVADFTQPGDLILDPYAGGGATLLAAAELGRRWCGYEINPEMAELAQLTAQHARPVAVAARAPKHVRK